MRYSDQDSKNEDCCIADVNSSHRNQDVEENMGQNYNLEEQRARETASEPDRRDLCRNGSPWSGRKKNVFLCVRMQK